MTFPTIRQVVLDTIDPRGLAEFYRQLFGLGYAPGDGPPAPGEPDPLGEAWLTLRSPDGGVGLAFQGVLLDRTDDPDEPLWVYADPAGHPFCVYVG